MSSCRQELITVTNFGFAITECMQIERQEGLRVCMCVCFMT